ncbi:protein kinase domain-containing protein [Sorangium sp. So ce131]|uniref:serine/threonine-protein kinase n=1 Tax=Sorangium sp. So ce131 TaxID=3133282 RepID=UPI003F610F4D
MSAPIIEGQVLAGKYRVERVLGKGGMGMVVAAMHQQLQQRVAMKFLLPGATQETIHRFLREARAAVRLKSEHVARVTDVDTLEDGTPYMVMEYLEGADLSQRIRQTGPLAIDEAVTYVLQACEAIAEAHAAGIVHRDLKPANLFLTTAADGSQMVKVLDFGIVKALVDAPGDTGADGQPAMALTRTTAIVGSPLYMSPEQLRSARSVDARADIWSMGVVLFQLLTARLPFETTEFGELFAMVTMHPPTSPRAFRPDLPEELDSAILACLRKPREERFQNMGELVQALAPFASVEAQVSVPRILRTLGLTAASPSSGRPSMPFGSRPSLSAFNASGVSTAPPGQAGPASQAVPGHSFSQPPARASVPPGAVARTAQVTSGPGSSLSPDAEAGAAAAPGARSAARRGAAGLVAAVVVALLTMTGGVVVVSQLWARNADNAALSPKPELSPENTASQVLPAPVPDPQLPSQTAKVEPAPSAPTEDAAPTSTTSPPPAPSNPATPPVRNQVASASLPQPKPAPRPVAAPTSTTSRAQAGASTVSNTPPRPENPLDILTRQASQNQQPNSGGKATP